MAEPRPNPGSTPGSGSPIATAIAVVGLVGGGAAVAISFVVRAFACGEAGGECSGGTALLVIACVGLIPVLVMLLESDRRRGHPWHWFVAAVFIYAFWAVVFMSLAG